MLSYERDSVQELEKNFKNVIDEYLKDCEERKVQPEQPEKYNDDKNKVHKILCKSKDSVAKEVREYLYLEE